VYMRLYRRATNSLPGRIDERGRRRSDDNPSGNVLAETERLMGVSHVNREDHEFGTYRTGEGAGC